MDPMIVGLLMLFGPVGVVWVIIKIVEANKR